MANKAEWKVQGKDGGEWVTVGWAKSEDEARAWIWEIMSRPAETRFPEYRAVEG